MFENKLNSLKSTFSVSVLNLIKTCLDHNYEIYIVGGAVRDALLGRPVVDIDMATNALPEQIEAIFPNSIPTGKAFGTITVILEDSGAKQHVQITTYRADGTYSNARHPDDIQYETDIHEDLKRRDFTVNALAFNPVTNNFLDDFNGLNDLDAGQLSVVGDAVTRFSEDTLRLFRCCRFAAQLDFDVVADTISAMIELVPACVLPSKERIHHELTALLHAQYPQKGLDLLKISGLGKRVFNRFDEIPELAFKYIEKMEISLRWPFLLQYLDLDKAFNALLFSKKEQRLISQLIKYDFDQERASFTIKDLVLTGKDIQGLGFDGKKIGEIQHYLFDRVIEDMSLNNKEVLLSIIEQAFN